MIGHSALIERLDHEAATATYNDARDALAEAAAALRDQQADLEKWKRLKGYADDQVRVERAAYRSLLADHEAARHVSDPLPSAPNQAKEAGE